MKYIALLVCVLTIWLMMLVATTASSPPDLKLLAWSVPECVVGMSALVAGLVRTFNPPLA